MQGVLAHELVVLLELKLTWGIALVLVGCVATHSWDSTVFLLCAFDSDDHSSALCFLSHAYLFHARIFARVVD